MATIQRTTPGCLGGIQEACNQALCNCFEILPQLQKQKCPLRKNLQEVKWLPYRLQHFDPVNSGSMKSTAKI